MQIGVKYYSEYRRYTIDLHYVRRNANGGACCTQKHRSVVQKRTYKLERLMSSAPSDTWSMSVYSVQFTVIFDTDLYTHLHYCKASECQRNSGLDKQRLFVS
jgi:hypothetical protein